MARLVWKVIHAAELGDALESSTLGQLVPRQPAVYLWRRKFIAPSSCRSSQEACQEWVKHVVGPPAATLTRRQLSHCVWTNGLQIGGGELTREKQQTLEDVSVQSERRRFLIDYIEALTEFTTPIYVGQAVDLRKRITQHLKGDTGLYEYVTGQLRLSWDDLELRYLIVSSSTHLSEDARLLLQLLELVTQRVLAPFGTERPG